MVTCSLLRKFLVLCEITLLLRVTLTIVLVSLVLERPFRVMDSPLAPRTKLESVRGSTVPSE